MNYSLPDHPAIGDSLSKKIQEDFRCFSSEWPVSLEDHVRETYGIDLTSEYGGHRIKNPFGKASGQLSLALHQIEKDAESGLGFAVLKTVIAEDEAGAQSMHEWAIKETHMTVERIQGASGREGWTVTWKGRGWHESFACYLRFFGDALEAGGRAGMLVVPSCKYHLPQPGEKSWRTGEYEFTTRALLRVWREHMDQDTPMPLEKDFSPTLAGSERASQMETILSWLRVVPGLIQQAAGAGVARVGLKIFNAMFDDDFQLEMLRTAHSSPHSKADFLVYANRLFDRNRAYAGKMGVAYGGPDLSDRNLRVLQAWRRMQCAGELPGTVLPLSGTGDIHSGRLAVEYLMRGCRNFQMHTFFQLPDSEYVMNSGPKTRRALHLLLFHPVEGFIAWICHLREKLGWRQGMSILEMADFCASPANALWKDS